ncbi:hypothetical protein [Acidithrix sp. C25]|uniref:hypothetical protein n=1 Tax=Acidithrix sp. C25 TaxID=1671482 RepID=UPI00191BC2D2|nr:hypothetical protein [Acidithrix sp. C25]CAG4926711.1 unnamed protein product [Acidithrix sp. C25]
MSLSSRASLINSSFSNKPIVGMASTPDGKGYWLVASDGGIFTYGDAGFYGSAGALPLNKPIVGMASTPDGKGYWLVASDGGIFTFGDAGFYGSAGAIPLNKPIVGMASTPDGKGYWLVASDGGIFTYGDAGFYGSAGALPLNKPIVGMASTPDGKGYWLVASDGGIFTYGDAGFYGSAGALPLNKPIVGMASTPDGKGYWLVASDGGIFTYGDAGFYGSAGALPLNKPIVGMASTPDGKGYSMVASDGGIFTYGDAAFYGSGETSSSNHSSRVILPPSNPATNVPPVPNYASPCLANNEATCLSDSIAAINNARASLEGLGPMVLPGDFASMSMDQQLFILINQERQARGLPLVLGLVSQLNSDAAVGANGFIDPIYRNESIPGATGVFGYTTLWSNDYSSPSSIYDWMYNDGLGSSNIDCSSVYSLGCWGHRDSILTTPPPGTSIVMGAASVTNGSFVSQGVLLVYVKGVVSPSAFTYTWDQALASGAS